MDTDNFTEQDKIAKVYFQIIVLCCPCTCMLNYKVVIKKGYPLLAASWKYFLKGHYFSVCIFIKYKYFNVSAFDQIVEKDSKIILLRLFEQI